MKMNKYIESLFEKLGTPNYDENNYGYREVQIAKWVNFGKPN